MYFSSFFPQKDSEMGKVRFGGGWTMQPYVPRAPTLPYVPRTSRPVTTVRLPEATRTPNKRKYPGPPTYTTQTPRKRRRHYQTSGANLRGRNRGGKFRKTHRVGRKRKFSAKYNANGVVWKQENGSTEATDMRNSIYVGHGVAPLRIVDLFYMSVVKKLFNLAGIEFGQWLDQVYKRLQGMGTSPPVEAIRFFYGYRPTDSGNITNSFVDIPVYTDSTPATTTFLDIAVAMRNQVKTDIASSAVEYGEFCFTVFSIQFIANGVEALGQAASIAAEDTTLELDVVSNLVIQNRTNDAGNSTNILSTSNNPLHGKYYFGGKKWLNGFDIVNPSLNNKPVGFVPLYTYPNQGIIVTNSGDTEEQLLDKPPQAWQLGCKSQKEIKIQPGDIHRSKFKFYCKMSLNAFVKKLQKYFTEDVGSNPRRVELGFAKMFGLECMLYDRSETTELQVGWELNEVYKMKLSKHKVRTAPVIEIL